MNSQVKGCWNQFKPGSISPSGKMRVRFIDLDGTFTAAIDAFGHQDILTQTSKVQDVVGREATAFLSPSNSLCFMDGGIDAAYMERWPGIQQKAMVQMRGLGFKSKLGRPYLPLGSAMAVDTQDEHGSWLVMAPTMWLPQDVSETQNAFHACVAGLLMAETLPVKEIVIPAMCCGYGKMTPEDSAKQCVAAVHVWRQYRLSKVHQRITRKTDTFCMLEYVGPQPRLYMNMEWQDFP